MVNNPTLLDIWRRHLAEAGIADDPIDPNAGSTDMANVSHEVPTIHPYLAIAPRGTPGHSREFAAHAGGEDGDRVLPIAIRILAATGVELLHDPEPGRAGVGRARRAGRCGEPQAEATRLSDILAGQPGDAELLAEIYDLEHDAIDEDLAFYREMGAARAGQRHRPRLRLRPPVRAAARRRGDADRRRRRLAVAARPRDGPHRGATRACATRAAGAASSSPRVTSGASAAGIGSRWRSWPACSPISTVPRTRCAR